LAARWAWLSAALGCIAIALYILIGLYPVPAYAATIETERWHGPGLSEQHQPTAFELTIDNYLSSIPSDYHAIRTVAALKSLIVSSNPLLIDVRTSSEYKADHIIEAINIPLPELDRHLEDIPTDQAVVLYCSTGYRSAMGVMALRLQGYTNVQGFPPGFAGWKAAGEPVTARTAR